MSNIYKYIKIRMSVYYTDNVTNSVRISNESDLYAVDDFVTKKATKTREKDKSYKFYAEYDNVATPHNLILIINGFGGHHRKPNRKVTVGDGSIQWHRCALSLICLIIQVKI